MNIVHSRDFDITKFFLKEPIYLNNASSTPPMQTNLLPMYSYQYEQDKCTILTSPIKVHKFGGIEDTAFGDNAPRCPRFTIFESSNDGSKELFNDVLDPLAGYCEKFTNDINNNKIQSVLNKKNTKHKKYKFNSPVVNVCKSDDDHITDRKINIHFRPERDSIDSIKDVQSLSNLSVFLPINKHDPIKDRIFKQTPEIVNNSSDLRKYYKPGCLIMFTLSTYKYWAQNMGGSQCPLSGLKIICSQMFILDSPDWKLLSNFDHTKIPMNMGIKCTNDPNMPTILPPKQIDYMIDEYEDVDNNSDSEDD